MKEAFLHYVWRFKKMQLTDLFTEQHQALSIIHFGSYPEKAGPDFFNARLLIGDQLWAGNVEMHVNASDWYLHQHQNDSAYDTVILHVVWHDDVPVFRKDNTQIPTLLLSKYVAVDVYNNFLGLMKPKSWIPCENQLKDTDSFIIKHWKERLFVERLEEKQIPISKLLHENQNDWEATLFVLLLKNFGLNVNGSIFQEIARRLPFHVIKKERSDLLQLEALLFGTANLLSYDFQEAYPLELKKRFEYLKIKYQLGNNIEESPHFFKLRPPNFPTIRLAQFAALYYSRENLFSDLIAQRKTTKDLIGYFQAVAPSSYWDTHFIFEKNTKFSNKKLTANFIELLYINTIVPFQFTYLRHKGVENFEELYLQLQQIPSEKNAVIDRFEQWGIMSHSAADSQALLFLKQHYCDAFKCLNCAVGHSLLS